MSLEEIGKCCGVQTLDIHAGGIDLIFPHHENEIAQSEGATGQPFSRHWVHGEFLNVRGTKMSKRHGNFLTARDLREQGVDAAAVRLLFFQTHYRQPVDFTDEALDAAKEGVRRLGEFHQRLKGAGSRAPGAELDKLAEKLEADVATALNDDLNARAPSPRCSTSSGPPIASSTSRSLPRHGGRTRGVRARRWGPGCAADGSGGRSRARALGGRAHRRRAQARKSKDFKAADAIRVELAAKGVEIEDTPQGTKWRLA